MIKIVSSADSRLRRGAAVECTAQKSAMFRAERQQWTYQFSSGRRCINQTRYLR